MIGTDTTAREADLAIYFEAVTALLGGSDRLKRSLGGIVEPYGITLQQYNVLRILRGAGSQGLPTMEVRARMIEKAPGITRLIDRLAHKGHVERYVEPLDRRAVTCRITRVGLALLKRLDAAVNHADQQAFENLSPAQVKTLCRLVDKVARAEE